MVQGVDRADKTLKNVKGGWGRTRSLHRQRKGGRLQGHPESDLRADGMN